MIDWQTTMQISDDCADDESRIRFWDWWFREEAKTCSPGGGTCTFEHYQVNEMRERGVLELVLGVRKAINGYTTN